MFTAGNRYLNKPKSKQYYRMGTLLPVLPAEQLLSTKEVRGFVHEIQTQCQLPPMYFEVLYQHALDNFAVMVQLVPYDEEEGMLAGFLNRGIARATLALRHYYTHYTNESDPLVAYAIFTAALFFDIAKLVTHFTIVLIDKDGDQEDSSEWLAFSGSMLGHGEHYKIFPKTARSPGLEHEACGLLVRQSLPKQGFSWIASDSILFNDWLLALRGATGVAGTQVCHILSLIKHHDLQELLAVLGQPSVEMLGDPSTELAEQFYRWLRAGLDAGSIKLNTNGLVFVGDLLYAEYEFLKLYLETKKLNFTVEQLRLGIERLFRFVNNENIHKRNVIHNDTQRLQQTNQSITVGFLNKKNYTSNGVSLPTELLLKDKAIAQTRKANSKSRSLPRLTENKKSLTPRAVLK